MLNNNQHAFYALIRAGLWGTEVRLKQYGEINFIEIYKIAQEQGVIGIIAEGVEHINDIKIPQDVALMFAGDILQIEQRNRSMNVFIAKMIEQLRKESVCALLVKGQGIAQCYNNPLWRSSGDIDLLLDKDSYVRAKTILLPMATNIDTEIKGELHQSLTIESWAVELHGTLHSGLSHKIDRSLDQIQKIVLEEGKCRIWDNEGVKVSLPREDEDVLFVFTHFLKHFYKGGIGIRQICDWCRLLWKYRKSIDYCLLESRIQSMGTMVEWKAFAAFAVRYLGMPSVAMPFYTNDIYWSRKADVICSFVMEVGNLGHKRDTDYYNNYPYLIRKIISLFVRCTDILHHSKIFPLNSFRYFSNIVWNGIKSAKDGV